MQEEEKSKRREERILMFAVGMATGVIFSFAVWVVSQILVWT